MKKKNCLAKLSREIAKLYFLLDIQLVILNMQIFIIGTFS